MDFCLALQVRQEDIDFKKWEVVNIFIQVERIWEAREVKCSL